MGKLQVLPAQVANLIAAGEVVQRPASAVKELMENSIDAGATRVDVVVTDGGRTLVQVIDNGCGMSPADAMLCFERHATSKIATAEDLTGIVSYGFRGEALPSIASVSEVCLKTRRSEDETGTEIRISGGADVKSSSAACPAGSSFSIRNLFFNTPARRKFLKSDNVELKHIVEEFTRIAIIRPDVAFSLNSSGRDLFVLKKAKSLKFRILDLLGSGVVGDIVEIEAHTTMASLSGFVGCPDSARKTLGNQFFFVNGRYFRSPYLHKAVMKAYEELMPEGLTPSYFIFIGTDPSSVDVNIHPSKAEVKFEDESLIFQIVYACVHETLGRNSFGASIDFESAGAVQMPRLGTSFEQYKGEVSAPAIEFNPDYNPFEEADAKAASPSGSAAGFSSPDSGSGCFRQYGQMTDRRQDYGKLFEQTAVPASRMMVIQGRYIVTPSSSGLMIVNIRRAWERIMYEKLLTALGGGVHMSQTSLFPVQVQVGVEQRLLVEENSAMLSSLGFDITPFGTDTVVVGGVPEGYSCEPGKVEQAVYDILLILADSSSSLPELMKSSMASKFATLSAVNIEALTSPQEAQRLVDRLFSCENAELTPSGKKISALINIEEIEKKF